MLDKSNHGPDSTISDEFINALRSVLTLQKADFLLLPGTNTASQQRPQIPHQHQQTRHQRRQRPSAGVGHIIACVVRPRLREQRRFLFHAFRAMGPLRRGLFVTDLCADHGETKGIRAHSGRGEIHGGRIGIGRSHLEDLAERGLHGASIDHCQEGGEIAPQVVDGE